jgi:hypothetical protein
MSISAIPTQYKGYQFRSRLEAKWAVFFDSAGIEWQYEKEGYQKNGAKYLPDFYFPHYKLWVEVKGNVTLQWASMMGEFLSRGCPLPNFDNSLNVPGGLLLLGDIPDPDNFNLHPVITHSKDGLHKEYVAFQKYGFFAVTQQAFNVAAMFCDDIEQLEMLSKASKQSAGFDNRLLDSLSLLELFSVEAISIEIGHHTALACDFYSNARRAQFEHGQSGLPKTTAIRPLMQASITPPKRPSWSGTK